MPAPIDVYQIQAQQLAGFKESLVAAIRGELQKHLETARAAELEARANIITAITHAMDKRIAPIERDVAELKKQIKLLKKRGKR